MKRSMTDTEQPSEDRGEKLDEETGQSHIQHPFKENGLKFNSTLSLNVKRKTIGWYEWEQDAA